MSIEGLGQRPHDEGTGAIDTPGTVGAPSEIAPPAGESLDATNPTIGITSLRRPSQEIGKKDMSVTSMLEDPRRGIRNTLTAAARRGEPVEVRLLGDGRDNTLTVKGRAFTGREAAAADPDAAREVRVNQPAGAKGVPLSDEAIAEQNDKFPHWRSISGEYGRNVISDTPNAQDLIKETGMPVEREVLAAQSGEPYAIVVSATPIDPETVSERAEAEKRAYQDAARGQRRQGDLTEAFKADEHLARHQELKLAERQGLWDIRMAVGAMTPEAADDLAIRVESAAHAPSLPYNLRADLTEYPNVDAAMREATGIPEGSTALLAHVLPIPGETEIPGIKVEERPEFSTNLKGASEIPEGRRVETGVVLDNFDNPAGPLVSDRHEIVRHEIIGGASGSGKTTYVERKILGIIEQGEAAGEPVGVLIVDPKKGSEDYLPLGEHLQHLGRDVVVIQPGNDDAVPVGRDPLTPLPGETIRQTQARVLRNLMNAFSAAGDDDIEAARSTFQYLREAVYGYERDGKKVEGIYERKGWNPKLAESTFPGGDPAYPTMDELVQTVMDVARAHNYQDRGANLVEFLGSRVGNLTMGEAGDFFRGHEISPEKIRNGITILKLDKVDDPMSRTLIISTMFDMTTNHLIAEQAENGPPTHPKFGFVFEEGNELAPKDTPVGDHIGAEFRRIRSAGGFIMMPMQQPDAADTAALGNASTRTSLRLVDGESQETMAKRLGLTPEQTRMLPNLDTGKAIHASTTGNPVLAQIHPPLERGGTPVIKGPEAVVDDSVAETYTLKEHNKAEDFVRTDPGKVVEFYAGLMTMTELMGLPDPTPNPAFASNESNFPVFADLRGREGEDRRVLDCAIRDVVTQAVTERAKMVLQDQPREPLIERITARVRAHIDGVPVPEEADVHRPLPKVEGVKAKADDHFYVSTNIALATQRSTLEYDMRETQAYLTQHPQARDRAEREEQLAKDRARASALDAALQEEYTAVLYDQERHRIVHDHNHPAYRRILSTAGHTDLADMLLPPNNKDYTINHAVGIPVGKAVESGSTARFMGSLKEVMGLFDLDPQSRALIEGEYRLLLERQIRIHQDKLAAEARKAEDRPDVRATRELAAAVHEFKETTAQAAPVLVEKVVNAIKGVGTRPTDMVEGTPVTAQEIHRTAASGDLPNDGGSNMGAGAGLDE